MLIGQTLSLVSARRQGGLTGRIVARRASQRVAGWWLRVVVSQPGEGRRGVCVHDREMTDGEPPSRTAEGLREMLDWAVTQSPVNVALLGTRPAPAAAERGHVPRARPARRGGRAGPAADRPRAQLRCRSLPGLRPAGDRRPGSRACGGAPSRSGRGPGPGLGGHLVAGQGPGRPGASACWSSSTDVTEQSLARERLALVNEASIRIGSTLDLTTTARGARRDRRPPAGRLRHDRPAGLGAARRRAGAGPGRAAPRRCAGWPAARSWRARPRRWPGRGRSRSFTERLPDGGLPGHRPVGELLRHRERRRPVGQAPTGPARPAPGPSGSTR